MCVSSFFKAQVVQATEAAAVALPEEWTPSTLAGASPAVRGVAARTGGLRSGQRLLSSAPVEGLIGVGLWWPWGDGGTISLRVGLIGTAPVSADALRLKLCEVFAVPVE